MTAVVTPTTGELDRSLFVLAGAGTGKTTMLVDRVVDLVRSGADIRGVAAITFTDAAAAELRQRIRVVLEREAPDDAAVRQALAHLDEAPISTLHAFAARILALHPLEAGLAPGPEVRDEVASAVAFDERWTRFLDELLADAAQRDVVLRAQASGLSFHTLREVAVAFQDHWDRLEHLDLPEPALRPVDAGPVVTAAAEARRHLPSCLDEDDLLAAHLVALGDWCERLEASSGPLETLALLDRPPRGNATVGRTGSWRCPVDDVREACRRVDEARCEVVTGIRREVATRLVAALAAFTLSAADERRRDGRLEFHDLLVRARNLVRDDGEVRMVLRARFTHLLIDEFQDTDPLQVELTTLLTADDASLDRGPVGRSVEGGRLFAVGDAMQSIYRFRRADLGVFERARALMGHEAHLVENRRSVPGVLAWVNAVFERLVGDGVPGVQPAYQPLVPARAPAAGEVPPVVLLGGPHAKGTAVAAVRRDEAAEIATTVRRMVGEGWPVGGRAGDWRPCRHQDIAVLLPTRTALPHLESALEAADLPYRVESASLVWTTQVVRELLAVLRALDDPTDAVALAAALRAPCFACGDDDLLSFRQGGGQWDLTAPVPDTLPHDHPVVAALAVLAGLHADRWWTGVSATVERVLRELRFFELALAHRRPRDHWRRLRWVLDQARGFEQHAESASLRAFLRWADHQAEHDGRVREASLPETDDDAVRIFTVHGAKGLQFPVAVLSGLNVGEVPRGRVFWGADGPEVQFRKGFETRGFAEVADTEKTMAEHERLRLLYVAATRAEDHLVVSLHHREGDDTHAGRLRALADTCRDLWRGLPSVATADVATGATPVAPPTRVVAGEAVDPSAWRAQRAARVAAGATAPVRAATALAELAAEALDDSGSVLGSATGRGRGRAGSAVGRAVHATLQSVDLATGDGLADLAAATAAAEGVAERSSEVERLAAAALGSDSVREAARRRHWRELYVAAPVEGMVVEGFVDLVFDAPAGLVVVDYKTDRLAAEADVDGAVGRHRLQGAAYALALEAALGRPVAACRFVFLTERDGARERAIVDLPAAVAEVRALLGRQLTGSAPG